MSSPDTHAENDESTDERSVQRRDVLDAVSRAKRPTVREFSPPTVAIPDALNRRQATAEPAEAGKRPESSIGRDDPTDFPSTNRDPTDPTSTNRDPTDHTSTNRDPTDYTSTYRDPTDATTSDDPVPAGVTALRAATARRRFLVGLGAIGASALAGCADLEDPDEDIEERTDRRTDDDTGDEPPVDPPDADGRILRDTDQVYAGYFTEFEGGILVGAHPMAITEPITVAVDTFEPEIPEPDWPEERTLEYDEFVEIEVLDHEEDWVETPTGTGFFVVVPVPEGLDVGRLEPMHRVYGDFGQHGDRDEWFATEGIYDADGEQFIMDVETLGAGAYPTRLGVIEQPFRETALTRPRLATILEEYFPAIEDARDGEPRIRPLASVHDAQYEVEWKAVASEDDDVIDAVESALEDAHPHFIDLAGDPEPRLITTLQSKFRWVPGVSDHKTFKYYIRDYQQAVSACPDPDEQGIDGRYVITTKFAYTCVGASDHYETTVHELFHAIQYDYPISANIAYLGSDDWVVEGTARTVQNLDPFEPNWIQRSATPRSWERPIDIALPYEDAPDGADAALRLAPYETQYFWSTYLWAGGFTMSGLGLLFEEGLDTDAARDFTGSLEGAHMLWMRDAVFEGFTDSAYVHECEFNEHSHFDEHDSIELADGPLAHEESPQTIEESFDLDPLSALTGRMYELVMDVAPTPYYYRLSFEGNGPHDAWLYPGHGPCFDDGPNWHIRTLNDRDDDTILLENRSYPVEMSAWLLVQGSIGPDAALRVEGPFRHNDLWIESPWPTDSHDLAGNLDGAVRLTAVDFADEVDDVELTYTVDGEPVDSLPLAQSPLDLPEFGRTWEYELDRQDLCGFYDPPFAAVTLGATMTHRAADGTVLDERSDDIPIELEAPAVTLSHTVAADERLDFGFPMYNPGIPNETIIFADLLMTDGITLTGSAVACDSDGGADVSDDLEWWNEDLTEPLSSTNELFLSTPGDFEDDDGKTRPRTVTLYYPWDDVGQQVTVQPCDPNCPEFREFTVPTDLFEPVMVCPDGSFDPHCAVRSLDEFETRLDDFVRDELFDGAIPETGFPLSDRSDWPIGHEVGEGLLAFVDGLFDLASSDEHLATGDFHAFLRSGGNHLRDLEDHLTTAEAALAQDLLVTLGVGLAGFGAPGAAATNGWRYFAYGDENLNPHTLGRQADLRTPVQTAILGMGAALERYAEDVELRRQRARLGATYGFLSGVSDEVGTLRA